MKKNWIVTLAACMVFSLSLSGCGTATDTASSTASSESSSEAETSGKSEQDLMDEENNILKCLYFQKLTMDSCQLTNPVKSQLPIVFVF